MSVIFVYANSFIEGNLEISNEKLSYGFESKNFYFYILM